MAYKIRFRKEAKAEIEAFCEIYPNSREIIQLRLDELAEDADKKKHDLSMDWTDLLNNAEMFEDTLESFSENSDFRTSWQRFKESGCIDKIKTCLTILGKRRSPWELRCTEICFTYSEVIPLEIMVVYEINHVNKEIVITLFHD